MAELLTKTDNIDTDYVNRISDEIFKHQPFFLTRLLGHHRDTSPEELVEIMKIYFLIWEYFRENKNVQTKKVTRTYFEKIQERNIPMLQYAEDEPGLNERLKIYSGDLQNLKSNALLTSVLYRFNQSLVLSEMDWKRKGIVLVRIKTSIECFETLQRLKYDNTVRFAGECCLQNPVTQLKQRITLVK